MSCQNKTDLVLLQERKKHYDSYFADRAQKQRLRGVIEEGLSTVERPEFELGTVQITEPW